MCLLKPSELNNNNCAHDECKNFRMLNKPACIYSFNPAGKPLNLTPSQNNSNSGLQNQQGQDLLGHRSNTYLNSNVNDDLEDDGAFVLNKKKLRVESNNGYGAEAKPAGLQTDIHGQQVMMVNQPSQLNSYDDKSLFSNPMLNNILIANGNGNKGNDQRNNGMPVMQMAQPMYIPYIPNQMGIMDQNMQGISYIPVQQGFQTQFQPQFQPQIQNLGQNLKMKSGMDINLQSVSTPSSAENFQKNFNIEEYMNQFQAKLSEVLVSQNKMLIDLREKNDLVQDTLACLINEVSALKQVVKQTTPEESAGFIKSKAAQLAQQFTDNSREIASSESLLSSLYGPNYSFPYQLVFKSELPLPLYRERNFKFTVLLTDKDGNLVKNCNRIPLSLAIYTSENPPKFVDVNTSGNKILKGIIDKDMVDGAVTFDKIQIKEVTSHFRNGWVFFVVYPKTAGTVFNRATPAGSAVLVDHNQIRPLVLERVVVKAKKLKEKDSTKDETAEDNGSEIDQEQ